MPKKGSSSRPPGADALEHGAALCRSESPFCDSCSDEDGWRGCPARCGPARRSTRSSSRTGTPYGTCLVREVEDLLAHDLARRRTSRAGRSSRSAGRAGGAPASRAREVEQASRVCPRRRRCGAAAPGTRGGPAHALESGRSRLFRLYSAVHLVERAEDGPAKGAAAPARGRPALRRRRRRRPRPDDVDLLAARSAVFLA